MICLMSAIGLCRLSLHRHTVWGGTRWLTVDNNMPERFWLFYSQGTVPQGTAGGPYCLP